MYSFPNSEPVHCSMCSSNCCFLTCIQFSQEAGKEVWYSHLLKNFPQFVVEKKQSGWDILTQRQKQKRNQIQTVKGFSIVSETEVNVFLEFSCFFYDLWFAAFSKSSLYIWKFSVHVLLKPGLENFEHYLASMWNQCNCAAIWHFPSLRFEWKLTFSSPVATAEFSKFAGLLSAAL